MQQLGQGIQEKIKQAHRCWRSATPEAADAVFPYHLPNDHYWAALPVLLRLQPYLKIHSKMLSLIVSDCQQPGWIVQRDAVSAIPDLSPALPQPGQRLTFTSSVGLHMTAASPPLVLPATTFFKKLGCVSAPIRRFTGSYRPSRAPAAGSRTSAPLCALEGALLPCCAASLCLFPHRRRRSCGPGRLASRSRARALPPASRCPRLFSTAVSTRHGHVPCRCAPDTVVATRHSMSTLHSSDGSPCHWAAGHPGAGDLPAAPAAAA